MAMQSSTPPMVRNTRKRAAPTEAKSTPTKRRRVCRKLVTPEVGSLLDIMHDYAGYPLFMRPLHWMDLHTQLLGCRFKQLPAVEMPSPPPSCSSTPESSPWDSPPSRALYSTKLSDPIVTIGSALIEVLSTSDSMGPKTVAMRTILSTLYPDTLGKPRPNVHLDLRFGRKRYFRSVGCQLLWKSQDPYSRTSSFDSSTTRAASQAPSVNYPLTPTSDGPPIFAYISRSHLRHVRTTGFSVAKAPDGQTNDVVQRLQVLRSKKLLPKNNDEDAYFVGAIIALAQESYDKHIRTSMEPIPSNFPVRVLTVAEKEMSFIVYNATVPTILLNMFREPSVAPTGSSEIQIEYARVPVWPVVGLKERLGKALGSDLVGNFDHIPVDTYDVYDNMVRVTEYRSRKRSREALSEVFNTSFSENRGPERQVPTLRKRRRITESQIGLVR